MLDSWKIGSRAERAQVRRSDRAVRLPRAEAELVERGRVNIESLDTGQLLEWVDTNALGGIGRCLMAYRNTGDEDRLREAQMTAEIMLTGLEVLLARGRQH